MKPKPVAILCADLHLSLTPPACRAETQEEWLDVQAHYLKQLRDIAWRSDPKNKALPIICAGDIFDRWNTPPELIHFAMDHLPPMLCIPGQHDLPNHQIERMKECGYGVLKRSRHIEDLSNWDCLHGIALAPNMIHPNIYIRGFGWGQEIEPPPTKGQNMSVAVVHRFLWIDGKGYPGAPEENKLSTVKRQLKGYDAAVFGDNHKGFLAAFHIKPERPCYVFNCGTFIRRKADEINYKPAIGILYSNGHIKPHLLDTSIDRFHDRPEEREQKEFDMREFLESLEDLGEQGMNFREALERHLRDNSKKYNPELARKVLALAWEEAKQK